MGGVRSDEHDEQGEEQGEEQGDQGDQGEEQGDEQDDQGEEGEEQGEGQGQKRAKVAPILPTRPCLRYKHMHLATSVRHSQAPSNL